jgi:mitochondrial chaperone BCS1
VYESSSESLEADSGPSATSSVSGHLKNDGDFKKKAEQEKARKSQDGKHRDSKRKASSKSKAKCKDNDENNEGHKGSQPSRSKPRSNSKRRGMQKSTRHNKEKKKARATEPAPEPPKPQLTLSGLLNVIDGVSAPQGHILLMTTNKIDNLDEALIRPGRIDLKIPFTLATKEQARQLFKHMYKSTRTDKPAKFDTKAIAEMAEQFAKKLPEQEFSCAHLQTYVLQYKTRPQEAVEQLPVWVATQRKEKAEELKRKAKAAAAVNGQG